MVQVLNSIKFDNAAEFADAYNKARLANKNKWIVYIGDVGGKSVKIKSFNMFVQFFDVDGRQNGDCYPKSSVKIFKNDIVDAIKNNKGVVSGQVIRVV